MSTMIGLVVESLPGEMDAASDRGVERFPPAACAVRVGSSGRASARGTADHGRSNVPVRGADRGRAGPGSGPRARAPQTLERGATMDAPRVVGRRTTVGHGEVVID